MPFDVNSARKEGYSDTEIADYLAKENKFDAAAARKEGYSDTEIIQYLGDQEALADTSVLKEAWKGTKAGWQGANKAVGSVLEYTGELTGAEPLKNIGKETSDYWGKLAEGNKARVSNFTDIKDATDFAHWASWNIGQMGSQIAVTAPFMVVGAPAEGSVGGFTAAKELLTKGNVSQFGKFLSQWAKPKAMDIPIGILEAGQVAEGQLDRLHKGETKELDPIRGLAATFVATKLEELGAENMVNRLFTTGTTGAKGKLFRRIGQNALATGFGEGTEEFFQQYAEQAGIDPKKLGTKEAFMDAVNGAAAGFIGGVAIGGVTGGASRNNAENAPAGEQTQPMPTPIDQTLQQEQTPEAQPAIQKPTSGGQFDDIIQASAAKHGVDPALIKAVIQAESGFKNDLTSPKGAAGLMQLMPGTAKMLGVNDVMDPVQNIDAGTEYLAGLLKRFGGDEQKALAAYNWGPGNVLKHGIENAPKETRDYIARVQGNRGSAGTTAEVPQTEPQKRVLTLKDALQSGKISLQDAINQRNEITSEFPETEDEINKAIIDAQASRPLTGGHLVTSIESEGVEQIQKTEALQPEISPVAEQEGITAGTEAQTPRRPDSITAVKKDMELSKQRREAKANEALQTETAEIDDLQSRIEQQQRHIDANQGYKGTDIYKIWQDNLVKDKARLSALTNKIPAMEVKKQSSATNLPSRREIVQPGASSQEIAESRANQGIAEDDRYKEAEKLVVEHGKASISMLQRYMNIGYVRAERLIQELEKNGVVSPAENGVRTVLTSKSPSVTPEQAVTEVKESWQMTRDEILANNPAPDNETFMNRNKWQYALLDEHKRNIEQAIAKGETVPPEVLKDYPDLATKQTSLPKAVAAINKNFLSTGKESLQVGKTDQVADAGKPIPSEIFIRPAEKKDLARSQKSLQAIPDKEGYKKVYKQKGGQGRGFYYVKAGNDLSAGAKTVAQRIVNDENAFIAAVQEQFGKTKEEAERVLQRFKKEKLVKIDPVMGQFNIKHGAVWEKNVIDRAAETEPVKKPKKKPAKAKRVPAKGAQNLVTKILELGGLKVTGKDYNTRLLRQDPDAKRALRMKSGLTADQLASRLQADGWPIESGDHLVELLKSGEGRNTYAPEIVDNKFDRQAERETNEWAEQQVRELDAVAKQLESEGIDAGRIEASSESVRADLNSELEAEGYSPEQIEANAAEIDDFFDGIIQANKQSQENQPEVASKKEKTTDVLTAEQAVQKYKHDQIAEAEKSNRAGSWDLSTISNYADRILKPYLSALEKYPFKSENYYKKFLFRNSKDNIVGNVRAKAKTAGLLETAYDKEGNPFYALKGTTIPEGLYSESFVTELDNKYNGWENIPAEAWEGTKKATPKGEFKNSELEGFGLKDTFGLLNPETDMSKHKPLPEQKAQGNEDLFAEKKDLEVTEIAELNAPDIVQKLVSGEISPDEFEFPADISPYQLNALWDDLYAEREKVEAKNKPVIEDLKKEQESLKKKKEPAANARKKEISEKIEELISEYEVITAISEAAYQNAQEKLSQSIVDKAKAEGIVDVEETAYDLVATLSEGRQHEYSDTWNKPLADQVLEELREEAKEQTNSENTEEEPQYSRTVRRTTGMKAENVQEVADKVTGFLKNAPKANIVQQTSEIPAGVLENMREQGILDENGDSDVQGFAWKGETWLVANNLDSPQEVVKILMHELTHDGLGKFFSTNTPNIKLRSIRLQYKSLMDAIYKAHGEEIEEIAKTTHGHLDTSTISGCRSASEEWLCNQAYEAQPKWYDRLVSVFNDIMRVIGFDVKLSDAEVRTVLQDAFKVFGDENGGVRYSIMPKNEIPRKTVTAYKLFQVKKKEPGKLYPLFIGRDKPFEVGIWYKAEHIPTKGFAERPGIHSGVLPTAPHLMKKDGTMPSDRVWAEISITADVDWQREADKSKTKDIRDKIPEGGYYRFKTNKMQGGAWFISGGMKIEKTLSASDVEDVLNLPNPTRPPEVGGPKYARSGRTLSIDEIIDKLIEEETAAPEAMPAPGMKESRAAIRLEKEAIARELTADFGQLAGYTTMNMQEQADMAQDVMNSDYEMAKRMAMGEIKPPPGVREASMYEAVKIRALDEGDVDTLQALATESTVPTILSQYGQAIKAADSYLMADPVKAMQEVIKDRIEKAKRTKGAKAAQAGEVIELRKKLEEAEKKLADYEAKRDEKQVKEAIDEVIKKPKTKKKVLGQKNKIVTLEEFQKLREKMRKKAQGTQLNAGLDPTDLVDLAKMGVFYIEAGVREFASWSKQFTEDVGEWVAPHTKEIYEKSLDLYHDGIVQGIRDDVRQAVTADSHSDIGRYANELAKHFISMGVTDRETLIDQVHEVLKEEIPDLTRRDTMDAISGYGKYKPLNKDEISTILRDIKGQILQVAKLQDLQQGNPLLKTGWERQAPSDEERRLVKLVEDAKKKYGVVTIDKERQLKSALDALKTRLENQIKDLQWQIDNRKKIVPVKHDIKRDAQAKALERKRDALKVQYNEIFGKPGLTDAQRQNIAIKALERSIVDLYRRIQQKDLSPMKKPVTPVSSPRIDMLRAEKELLRKEYKELKDLANPKKTPEEIALKSLKTRLKNEAKKYSEMLDNLNFEPRQRRQVILDAEGKKLKEDRDRIKQAYQEASKVSSITKEEAENIVKLSKIVSETKENLEKGGNRFEYGAARVAFERYVEHLKGKDSTLAKMLSDRMAEFKTTYKEHQTKAVYELLRDSIQTVADTSISLVASLDNSFIGRQGLKVLFTHPTVWWPAARESFRDIYKVMRGQDAIDALMADVYSRPNCLNGSYDLAKLIPKSEEQFPVSFPERVPYAGRVFKASQQAFEGAAIRMRTDLFDLLAKTGEEAGENVTDKVWVQDVGKLVSSLTARGSWGKRGEPAIVRVILWAPKMLKANLDVLTAHGAGAGLETSFARKQAALNLLKIVGSTALLMAAAAAMGADVEDDPRSTDFGKIKVGDTRFDITGGAASIITLAARLLTGSYKSASSGLVKEYGSKYADRTRWDAFIDFLMNKTSPPARVVVDMLKGRNWKGEPFTWSGAAYQALTPISIQNAIQLKDKSSADRIVGVLADVVGINTQSFTASEKTWDEEQSKEMKQFHDRIGEEKFKEANKKYNDRVNAWYDSAKSSSHYQRLSDDQKEEAWRKERAKAKKAVFREYHFWPKRTK